MCVRVRVGARAHTLGDRRAVFKTLLSPKEKILCSALPCHLGYTPSETGAHEHHRQDRPYSVEIDHGPFFLTPPCVCVCVRNVCLSPLPTLFLGRDNLAGREGEIFCDRGRKETEKGQVGHTMVKFRAIGMVSGLSAMERGESEQEIKSLKLYLPPSCKWNAPLQAK